MIFVSGYALIIFALMLLVIPLRWLTAFLLAAVFHEFGHIITLKIYGGKIHSIRVGFCGAVIESYLPDKNSAFFSILAGPLCSLSLAGLCRIYPQLAICGVMQGVFNLLPVYPLDGGKLVAIWLKPGSVQIIRTVTEYIILLTALAAAVIQNSFYDYFLSVMIVLIMLRNFPCKENRIGLQ